ncbi:MAG: hypothetical protein IKN77_02575 [Paludibacteraceae bacterium]|nr:hypothetical protein [Paludibacteraceae bacterium]
MKKNFFKWAVLFTALATALSFSSCGDDDDDDNNQNQQNTENNEGGDDASDDFFQFTENSISVKEGDVILYTKEAKGTLTNIYEEFTVVSATDGKVVININGAQKTLSDAGASYLSEDFQEWKTADAKANPSKVLFCLKGNQTGSTVIIDGTLASNSEISSGATPTYFKKK